MKIYHYTNGATDNSVAPVFLHVYGIVVLIPKDVVHHNYIPLNSQEFPNKNFGKYQQKVSNFTF